MRIDELADAIATLPLDDARALVAALKARLAVDDPLSDLGSLSALYGAPPRLDDDPVYRPHRMVLVAVGPDRARVISAIRVAFSRSVVDAKAIADAVPCELGTMPDGFAAEAIVQAIRAAGATIDVHPLPA
ncbi:MAG: hypothetical protein U0325_10855 [Polyangiales bacterium]